VAVGWEASVRIDDLMCESLELCARLSNTAGVNVKNGNCARLSNPAGRLWGKLQDEDCLCSEAGLVAVSVRVTRLPTPTLSVA
jgi:hypothetical protein